MIDLPEVGRTIAEWLDPEDDPPTPSIRCVSIRLCRDGTDEVLTYLAGLGRSVRTLDDLLAAVTSLMDEEELSAVRVREGVLLHHASDGWFKLYVD